MGTTRLSRDAGFPRRSLSGRAGPLRRFQQGADDFEETGAIATPAWFDEDGLAVHVAHVGSSRLHRLRAGNIEQLTRDHTVMAESVRMGIEYAPEANSRPHGRVCTRSHGQPGVGDPFETFSTDLVLGDVFAFLTVRLNVLSNDQLKATLTRYADPVEAADELIRLAKDDQDGSDMTAIVIAFR